MKKLIIFLLFILVPIALQASDAKIDGVYYNFDKEKKTATVTYKFSDAYVDDANKNAYSGDVVIPEVVFYNNVAYNVTAIGSKAFKYCKDITSLTIPKSIRSIGSFAFENCAILDYVNISDIRAWCGMDFERETLFGLDYQYNNPLYFAHHLYLNGEEIKDLKIPNNVWFIADYAFYCCYCLKSVTIPSSVTYVGEKSFHGNGLNSAIINTQNIGTWLSQFSSIQELTLGENVTTINENAIKNFENLDRIEMHTKVINSWFSGLKSIKEVILGEEVTTIGDNAFKDCSRLKKIVIPNNVISIGNSVFENCSSLTSVDVPNRITSIRNFTFQGCTSLTSVTIPNSVTSIDKYAFAGCKGLTNITIPENVTSISNSAFYGCENLSSVTIHSAIIRSWFSGLSSIKEITIGEEVTSIGNSAFRDCKGITNIDIPANVTSIGSFAFCGCNALANLNIHDEINAIGSSAFWGCSSLMSIKIPKNLTTISDDLFYGCGLTSITIPQSVTSIGKNAFYGCSGLTSITIPQSVTSIGKEAFRGCNGLTNITIGNSVTSIGDWAFRDCSGLKEVNFNATNCTNCTTTKSYDDHYNYYTVFPGCSSLTTLNIGNNVQNLPDYAFRDCSGLTSLTIPNSVTSIGNRAFSGCSGLTSVTIGNSVTKIGNWAFWGCSGLTNVTIGNSVTSIGGGAFWTCSNLSSVTLGNNNLTEIGQNAFPSQAKLYVKRGTKTLLTLWKNGYTRPYEIGTDKQLPPSSLSVVSTTQMTATIKVNDYYDGFTYTLNDEPIGKNTKTFYAPYPGYKYSMPLKISLDDVLYITNPYSFQTKGLNMKAERTGGTASSMTVKASYEHGDAPVTAQTLSLGGVTVEDDEIYLNGLKPSASYTVTYTIITDGPWKFQQTFKFSTNALNFTASQPKVISEGNVIIASKSNLDDGETNVGFEWRRTDWTSEFPSNRAGAYLYEGMMEGYIRNLNTNYLWKYRPYYETQDGSRFYGDWTGIDPTNTSYFEPTVHTYDKIEVNGNRARVKGYAMRGSDNIVSQGFRYWRSTESASRAKQVEADGQVMSIELKGLDYHTTYRVVAFVTTSEGKTYYGKEQLFTTGDPTGIEETFADEPQKITEEGIYDLSGRKLERMQKGINIIRKADGTTKKVLVK